MIETRRALDDFPVMSTLARTLVLFPRNKEAIHDSNIFCFRPTRICSGRRSVTTCRLIGFHVCALCDEVRRWLRVRRFLRLSCGPGALTLAGAPHARVRADCAIGVPGIPVSLRPTDVRYNS